MSADVTGACPHCGGRGRTYALLNVGGRCRDTILPCRTCEGTGLLSSHELARLAAATRLRNARVVRHLSQQEAGRALGLTPLALNDAEWGRGPLTTEAIDAMAMRVAGLPARGG